MNQDHAEKDDVDFDAIESAVMETARGRWFLAEYARRQRRAETDAILAALDALGRAIQQQQSVIHKQHKQQSVVAPYKASARFTPCLRVGVGMPSQPGKLPPRALPAQLGAVAVPVPRQSMSAPAAPGASMPMQGTRDETAQSSLLFEPDALDFSRLVNVA